MVVYLISRKDIEILETVVFAAGPHDEEEAVAVFTDEQVAEKYINEAGLADEFTVATVEPIAMLQWIVEAYQDGVHYLVVNPDYATQQSGKSLETLDIETHLEQAAEHILQSARHDY